ncbi:glycosyltransferase family 2 protein [Deinococcus frigens]|uniref:glycosyltransferase family 2 protein n=1 Tax=Deinococcus frigens TaxID=249403 RepID=UPI0004966520|nr:glycosyltransferase [Deinococcus frigens]
MTSPALAVIVPALNASRYVSKLASSFRQRHLSSQQVFILDSVSQDGSPELWQGCGFGVRAIDRNTFDHGGTRNLGARLATEQGAQILVFMTQDAIPADDRWLEALTAPIVSGQAVATFARQLPRPEASLLEQFSRYFNYPSHSRRRTEADIPELGVKAFFFSNVCSAVCADVFWEVGGFPEHIIMNEDMTLAAKLLRAGHAIEYVAGAQVVHSHDYTLAQQFRRNFDVGAFFAGAGPELAGAKVGGEGLRFVREQLRYVLRHRRADLIPLVIAEAAAKFSAFQLGKRHHLLPLPLKKKLSMHSYHWD